MIVCTTHSIAGHEIVETIGLCSGNTVRARHVGKDLQAIMKNMVGGEIDHYTKLLAEAREQARDRMIELARARGADAIVGVRFATSEIASGAAEILCYGTAVKLRPVA